MSCLFWNCRGLGQPHAIRALKDLIRSNRPNLVFLIETKMSLFHMSRLKFNLGFQHFFGVDREGLSGGLLLLWNDVWEVSLQCFSRGHIDVMVRIPKGGDYLTFFLTGFYGNPVSALRKDSW